MFPPPVLCAYDAKVVESTFSVVIQYRKFGDSAWIQAGAAETSVSPGTLVRGISGLLRSPIYEVRFSGTRTTANATTWSSTTVSFQTLADAPTIATNAASGVSANSATLNGTVDPNGVAGVQVRFGWGTADGGAALANWQNSTALQNFSGDGNQAFSQGISGLSASTLYFFRAFVTW